MKLLNKKAVQTDSREQGSPPREDALFSSCIIATIGFSCYFGWELSGLFAPATHLLSQFSPFEIAGSRIPYLSTLIVILVVAFYKADWFFDNRSWVLPAGISFSLITVIVALFNHLVGSPLPFVFQVVSWISFGIGQAAFLLYWAVYFSLIPTRYTPVAITFSSAIGTLFFVAAANFASPYLSLCFQGLMIVCSLLVVIHLANKIPKSHILPTKNFNKHSSFTFASGLSIGTHNLAYGFTTITLFALGPTAAVIGGASGLIGTLLCLLWHKFGSKVDVGTSILQRVTLPPIVIGLLLLPFVDDTGKLICCCILNIALSHFAVMGWINTTTSNSEFQLHPILCSAASRIPGWIGFLAGTIYAICIYFVYSLSGMPFQIAIVLIVIIITSVSALYGMDDSRVNERLSVIMTKKEASDQKTQDEKPSKYFKQSCNEVIKRYGLSPREADVFHYLARGRNAEYISKQLVVSSSTIKTHIYHIYQKMGINSQQNLMNVVESTQLSKE